MTATWVATAPFASEIDAANRNVYNISRNLTRLVGPAA